MSLIKPVLSVLRNNVLAPSLDDTTLTSDMKSIVLHYIENKYDDQIIQKLLNILLTLILASLMLMLTIKRLLLQ